MRPTPVAVAALALGLLLLTPDAAFAWGPATHVQIGMEVLRSLDLLPGHVAAVLAQYPIDFLYGNLAADISLGKKYAQVGRHCHDWAVARELLDEAGDDERLVAASLGYCSHLAADTLAHNSFVPRMLLLTSSTRALGHSYWEHRMDSDVGPEHAALARWIVTRFDHSAADALFRRVLSSTLFSFGTNRRIFRGIVRINGNESWQAVFDSVVDNSRWDLDPTTVARYLRHAFDASADYLRHGEDSGPAARDPVGERALGEAKRIRRRVLLAGGWRSAEAIEATADHHFALPIGATELWLQRGATATEAAAQVERELVRARSAPPVSALEVVLEG
ncbi:MAG: zinc dependent phospholipase C family protein [Gemmatimonadota bacterium]|nr:zinc dependent phospholipase C family protein [Gemmatimonadota bacterium]